MLLIECYNEDKNKLKSKGDRTKNGKTKKRKYNFQFNKSGIIKFWVNYLTVIMVVENKQEPRTCLMWKKSLLLN